jgi:hypothetical protein
VVKVLEWVVMIVAAVVVLFTTSCLLGVIVKGVCKAFLVGWRITTW